MMSASSSFFSRPSLVFGAAILFRVVLLIYGRWQDANSPMKYTDIDYLVFTDAARFMSRGRSPYDRATYRYTPLLAWLLLPTTWETKAIPNSVWFDFGKALFAAGDIVTGWFIMRILVQTKGMSTESALKYASLWLLNPMVANISTRGSSEGLVAVIVTALLWAVLQRRIKLAGFLLGLGVHFKIYPFIYAASIWWWLGSDGCSTSSESLVTKIKSALTPERLSLAIQSFCAFMALNCVMYFLYVRSLSNARHLLIYLAMDRPSSNIATGITSLASTTGITSRSTTPFFISTAQVVRTRPFVSNRWHLFLSCSFQSSSFLGCLLRKTWRAQCWRRHLLS